MPSRRSDPPGRRPDPSGLDDDREGRAVRTDLFGLLTLAATRRLLAGRRRIWVGAFAFLFGVAALLSGGMLDLFPTQGGYIIEVIAWGAPQDWWYYPELLAVQPWGILQLPFFATVAMTLVALGAGTGAASALVVARDVMRARRVRPARLGPSGVACGSAPGVASLATVGACCCTGCTSSAGIIAVAAASGSTAGGLLGLEWYLPALQLLLVYALLLVQERYLRRPPVPSPAASGRVRPSQVASAIARGALLLGGLTWGMAMWIEWTSTDPFHASAAIWYHWLVEHGVLSALAIALALFPRELEEFATRAAGSLVGMGLRTAALVGGITWGIGVPPALVGVGLGGTVNELLGSAGVSATGGGTGSAADLGLALAFHWGVQHLLLGGVAVAFAIRPIATAHWMRAGGRARNEGGALLQGGVPDRRVETELPALAVPEPGDR